ncbi:translocation/assembly module TamB [Pendulispora brunnea]|uniref:Translocation/assembly module TamB n=1 Tax=Pendulispora brunnea TaxID=2905690 RepID=A0ABZ2KH73_9BACT
MRSRRVLGILGTVVGTTVTFVTATVAGALLHLDLPATRRVAAHQIHALLAQSLKGRIALERIAHLGLDGVRGVRAQVTDPSGQRVLLADGVDARLSAMAVLKSALLGKGDIEITVTKLDIAYLEANLDDDQSSEHVMRLLRAFEPVEPPKPVPPKPPDPTARGLRLFFPHASLTHGWVHGTMAGAPALDVDADGLSVRVLVAPKDTRIDLDGAHLAARGMPNRANPHGNAEFHLAMPSHSGESMELTGRFDGDAGGVPAHAHARMNGDRLDAVLDVPRTEAERLRGMFDPPPVREPFEAHAEVHGELSRLEAKAHVTAGPGAVDVTGTVGLGADRTHVVAHVAARDVDVRAFSETAPASKLAATSEIELAIGPQGALSGVYTFDVLPGSFGPNAVPPAHVRGRFTEDSARAEGSIEERGAPVAFEATMRPVGEHHRVDFAVSSNVPAVERVPRLESLTRGLAGAFDLKATGSVDVEGQTLDARLQANVRDFAYTDTAQVARATVDARATGTFSAPRIDASVHASDVVAGGYDVRTLGVRGSVDPVHQVVRNARVTLDRNGETVSVNVDRLVAANALKVDGLVISGLGAPAHASLSKSAHGLTVHAKADGLDLDRMARLLDVQDKVSGGTLAFAIDASLAERTAKGRVDLSVEDATVSELQHGNVELAAVLNDDDLDIGVKADFAEAGHISLRSTKAKLHGTKGPLDVAAWKGLIGRAALDGEIDLERIASLVPPNQRPFGEMKGKLDVTGTLRRDSPTVAPEISLSTQTRGLVLAGTQPETPPPVGRTKVVAPPAWRSSDVDAALNLRVDATSGHAELSARLVDAHGPLMNFDAKAELPYNELWSDPDPAHAMAELEKVPFEARFQVPRRKVADLPPALRTKGMPGNLELNLSASGNAQEPRLAIDARLSDFKVEPGTRTPATDTRMNASYDGKRFETTVRVNTLPGTEVLTAKAQANVNIEDLLHPVAGRELPWDADLQAKLANFPLQSVSQFSDMQVRGTMRGELAVQGIHKDARARARLDIEKLAVGEARYKGGFIEAHAGGPEPTEAVVRFDQDDGFFEARARATTTWGAAVAPALDESKPVEANVSAQHFRVAALEPFLAGAVSDLDGYLDAKAQGRWDPRSKDAKMSGQLAFREGVVNLPALGDELHGVRATVKLTEDGRVRVDDVVAHGTEGRLSASAEAKLAGTKLEHASGKVHIREREALPLALQGEPIGAIYGDVSVDLRNSPDGRTTTMNVNIPSFHTKLPPTGGNSVQDLEARNDIQIGVERKRDELTKLPLDQEDYEGGEAKTTNEPQTVTTVNVHLGDDVEIRRSTDVKVGVTGDPRIQISGEKTKMTGRLRLTGGFIELQGKKLEIERGTVSFVGEPNNPEIVVTARWNAPDGTLVYADFVGPLKTGKVNLRSEPPRPKNEIVALLMFGTAEGSQSTPYPQRQPDGTVRAVGMGGAYAAQGLNKGIEDLAGTDRITAHIDTTQSANPRPELEFQLSRSLAVKLGHALGVPPLDRPDRNFLIISWRVKRNWTLETTFGDRGTSIVDGVWQRRY